MWIINASGQSTIREKSINWRCWQKIIFWYLKRVLYSGAILFSFSCQLGLNFTWNAYIYSLIPYKFLKYRETVLTNHDCDHSNVVIICLNSPDPVWQCGLKPWMYCIIWIPDSKMAPIQSNRIAHLAHMSKNVSSFQVYFRGMRPTEYTQ